MDRIAAELNLDPSEFREKNLLRKGDTTSFGQLIDHSVGMQETIKKAKEESNWKSNWKPAPIFKDNPSANGEDIREGLSGVLYRCTGYTKIIKAVKYVQKNLK